MISKLFNKIEEINRKQVLEWYDSRELRFNKKFVMDLAEWIISLEVRIEELEKG